MKAKPLLIISFLTAIIPLVVGSAIFWKWFYSPSNKLVDMGIYTILVSAPACTIGIILAIIFMIINRKEKAIWKKGFLPIFLNICNIPACYFYICLVIYIHDNGI